MSVVAGKLAPQIGANLLEKRNGGSGVLLGGIPGVPAGNVTIIGGGVAGQSAAEIALGLGANVTVLDTNIQTLENINKRFGNGINTLMSSPKNLNEQVQNSDLVIGAVLIPGMSRTKSDFIRNA